MTGTSSPKGTRKQKRKSYEQDVRGHAPEDQKQIQTPGTWISHTGSVHMKYYSSDFLIQCIVYLFHCEE